MPEDKPTMAEKKKTTTGVDIATLNTVEAAEKGFELELEHPVNGTPLDVFITVLGVDSAEYKKAQHATSNRFLKKKKMKLTSEEFDANALETLVACTTGWRNMVYEGEELPFTKNNVKMLYTKVPWIREQVDEAIADRSNFLRD